ncbi:MAG: arylsulfatase [Luteolibacter sp.]
MKSILASLFLCFLQAASAGQKPNIVIILADDLGYGDVNALNPGRCKIPTPHLDRLAAQGMTFTEAHTTSAVCTPSRYGLLTGRYNWRSTLQNGVLAPYAKPLIAADRLTLPRFLGQQGYDTACIGKWHLGWDWPKTGGKPDFTKPISGGPTTRGFGYYFGTDVPNYPPYCFIENDRTVGTPDTPLPKELLGNNLASKPGPGIAGWDLEQILPGITDKACTYITTRAAADKPFFLFMPLTSPHTPLAVAPEWKGVTKLGLYADFVAETDAMIGRVLEAIDKSGAGDRTLVFFSSDNGCAPYVGVPELEKEGHFPSADRRGYKADIFDGGHRVPLLARWPGKIQPGSTSSQMVSLVDLMATCSDLIGEKYPETAGEDSVSLTPVLLGKADKPVHEALVFHSINGSFAIRKGPWKLELCAGSGGWSTPKPGSDQERDLPPVQLYDLSKDIAEQHNQQAEHPEIVAELMALLEKYISDGRQYSRRRTKERRCRSMAQGCEQSRESRRSGGSLKEHPGTRNISAPQGSSRQGPPWRTSRGALQERPAFTATAPSPARKAGASRYYATRPHHARLLLFAPAGASDVSRWQVAQRRPHRIGWNEAFACRRHAGKMPMG